MLDLAYPSLTQIGDTYGVGPVSDKVSEGYLWHYWIPTLALLDREHLRLRKLDQVLMEGGPFVFPLEFRWELIDCLARGLAANSSPPTFRQRCSSLRAQVPRSSCYPSDMKRGR